jgi:hypothetical protein
MPPTRSLRSLRSVGMTFRLGCQGQPVVMSFRICRPTTLHRTLAPKRTGRLHPKKVGFEFLCGAGVSPAPGVWHFSAEVLADRNHGEVLIDDMLESRLERQLVFLVVRSGVG